MCVRAGELSYGQLVSPFFFQLALADVQTFAACNLISLPQETTTLMKVGTQAGRAGKQLRDFSRAELENGVELLPNPKPMHE